MWNIKEKIDIDGHLINYAWFVKTSPFVLKFGMVVGIGM